MRQHVRILGWLHIIFGGLGLLAGLAGLLLFGGIAGVVGFAAEGGEGLIAAPIIAAVGGFILVVVTVLSMPGLIGGIGLLYRQPWARVLMIVVSILHLLNFPFGTALGAYGLWVLFSPEIQTASR